MKMKKTILSCLMLLAGLTASAQEQKGTTEYVFEPHWYVQVQPLGVQYTLGEISFGDLLSYNVQAAVGRQFTPVWGARLAVNAWKSKGGSKYDATTAGYAWSGKQYEWDWNFIAPTIDGTVNLSNLVAGFNPNRIFNLSAFVGVGVNYAWNNGKAVEQNAQIKADLALPATANDPLESANDWKKFRLVGQAGLIADFKINDNWSVNLEVAANTLSDSYNSKKAKNSDWYFNALAGVKYNFGKTYSTRFIPAPEPEIRYVEKIVEKIVEVPA